MDDLDHIYCKARKLPRERRAAYLDEACRGDQRLRARVEQMLALASQAEDWIQDPPSQAGDDGPGAGLPPSVIQQLRRRSGARLDLHLHGPSEDSSPPVRMDEETRKLRDSSGRYQIHGAIGRGGIGVVYKGRDTDLGREVALKVLRDEYAQSDEILQRFIEEAQIGGQLQHPGIAPVYGLGLQASGRPFFAMKLIKGETLSALLQQGKGGRGMLGKFEQIAQTLAYAHSRGVLHRDLKPANVMIGSFGEVQVVDWGLSKVLGRDDEVATDHRLVVTVRSQSEGSTSQVGSVLGTPAYMSPEQASGNIDQLSDKSDVFSLGAILCEMITGRPAYTGTMDEMLLEASQADLEGALLALSDCDAPEAVKQLARDCMEANPQDRPTAAVLAARLADHLASAEERAREAELEAVRAAAEIRRSRRTRRTVVALASVALIALVGGGVGYSAWSEGERLRSEQAAAKVSPLILEATRLEGLEAWTQASSMASAAFALAESAGADPETRGVAAELKERLGRRAAEDEAQQARRRRERELLRTLDELAMRTSDVSLEQVVDRRHAALREYGLGMAGEPMPSRRAELDDPTSLAARLDEWAWETRQHPSSDWRAVTALARAIDPDPWRDRLRDAVVTEGAEARWAALRSVAEDPELEGQPAVTLATVALALYLNDAPDTAIKLLNRTKHAHLDDFWLHQRLASALLREVDQPDRARPHVTAALALRPESASVWSLFARVRERDVGDHEGAVRAVRRAVQLDPLEPAFQAQLDRLLAEAPR